MLDAEPISGGTWQGYTLGTIGAVLIVWLALLGVRKRRYRANLGYLEGWTSAHIYLGVLVLILSLMHSALQLGSINIHTLTFWFMLAVVLSGFFGLYVYFHLPIRRSNNLGDGYPERWAEELHELDQRIVDKTELLSGQIVGEILSALQGTVLGGSKWDQLFARDRSKYFVDSSVHWQKNVDQREMIVRLSEALPLAERAGIDAGVLAEVFEFFGQRQQLLRRMRKEIQFKALLKIWLYIHIPLTFALLLALATHIFVIFYYW